MTQVKYVLNFYFLLNLILSMTLGASHSLATPHPENDPASSSTPVSISEQLEADNCNGNLEPTPKKRRSSSKNESNDSKPVFTARQLATVAQILTNHLKRYRKTPPEGLLQRSLESLGMDQPLIDLFLAEHFPSGFNLQSAILYIQEIRPSNLTHLYRDLQNLYVQTGRRRIISPSWEEFATALNADEEYLRTLARFQLPRSQNLDPEALLRKFHRATFLQDGNPRGPYRFDRIVSRDLLSEERQQRLLQAVTNHDRLVVVTARAYTPINETYFQSLMRYCRETNATLLVIPSEMRTTGLDPRLLNDPNIHLVLRELHLGPDMVIDPMAISERVMNPITGLLRKGTRQQTLIFGAKQQVVMPVATQQDRHLPTKFLITTGALTEPGHLAERTLPANAGDGRVGADHVRGALVLERSMGSSTNTHSAQFGFYHFRHISYFEGKGKHLAGLIDVGRLYTPRETRLSRPEALDLGDIHVGDTDQAALQDLIRLIRQLKPKRVALHDLFNGHSVNHHERERLMARAKSFQSGRFSLVQELNRVRAFVEAILLELPSNSSITIIPSNHNDWLSRYLNSKEAQDDPHNAGLVAHLRNALLNQGESNPLEFILKSGYMPQSGEGIPAIPTALQRRIIFPEHGHPFVLCAETNPVEIGIHGHDGPNGARGSLANLRFAADGIVFGHTHQVARFNRAVNVGTFTELGLPYSMGGPNSWRHGAAIIGADGSEQLIVRREGEWVSSAHLETDPSSLVTSGSTGLSPLPSKEFRFPHGYPKLGSWVAIPSSRNVFIQDELTPDDSDDDTSTVDDTTSGEGEESS